MKKLSILLSVAMMYATINFTMQPTAVLVTVSDNAVLDQSTLRDSFTAVRSDVTKIISNYIVCDQQRQKFKLPSFIDYEETEDFISLQISFDCSCLQRINTLDKKREYKVEYSDGKKMLCKFTDSFEKN